MISKILMFCLLTTLGFSENIDITSKLLKSSYKRIPKMLKHSATKEIKIDQFAIDGHKFFRGETGVSEEIKIYLVKCPYKICKEEISENKVVSYNKDYKSGLILFRKSVEKFENTKSAEIALGFLLKQLNYRERRYSKFLVEKFPTRIGSGYDYDTYVKDVIFFAKFLSKKNKLMGHEVMGELYYFGVLGQKIDKVKSKEYYDKASLFCRNSQSFKCTVYKSNLKKRKF